MAIAITSSAPDFGPFQAARFAFPAFGVAFVIFGIVLSVRNYQKAKDYRIAFRRYSRERENLRKT